MAITLWSEGSKKSAGTIRDDGVLEISLFDITSEAGLYLYVEADSACTFTFKVENPLSHKAYDIMTNVSPAEPLSISAPIGLSLIPVPTPWMQYVTKDFRHATPSNSFKLLVDCAGDCTVLVGGDHGGM